MKKTYSKPSLVCHGDVATLTQVLGQENRTDFVFSASGQVLNGQTDEGSSDIQF
ncbi:MAG: lasso peptide [Phormidesmis sp. RL_2_1]|nr:lasso peptide [Phormidesmis sp. RL_2_1]